MEPRLLKTLPANTTTEITLENYIKHATLQIWCDKNAFVGFTQYVIYKCFIIEFDLLFLCTMGIQDYYFYTGKKIKFCYEPDSLTEENIKTIYDRCDELETNNFLELADGIKFINRELYYSN